MTLYVRTGNGGSDPDFQIEDLVGFVVPTGATWTELTASDAANPAGGAGQFTAVELKESADLYDALIDGYLEYSIDGYAQATATYRADTALVLDFFDDAFDIRGGRLILPGNGVAAPTIGEIYFSQADGYTVVYDGYEWRGVSFSDDVATELTNYFNLFEDETVRGHTTFDPTVTTDPAFTIAPDSSAPTTNVSDGSITIVSGITYVYDNSRSKWLSLERKFLTGGRDGNIRNTYLDVSERVRSSDAGYRVLRNATITGLFAQTRDVETWTLEIRRNGGLTAIATLDVILDRGATNPNVNIDVDQDDELQLYLSSSARVRAPVVGLELAWRI